ncbi:NAD(P)-binding protein [Zopfia rhizophila CBS 207.26]|uniref:NAD(P)-binding protein n=1 Tax=Zopfia rhizophila CBS 207.26 TaxID=1314779 RepID=A0A6A6DDU2_9PEZI|nr:NAD(P)-binding protein [Zopfia rhizophila CBS 207.26]
MANPNFGFETTAEEVASTYADQIKGKTILVTGVSPNGLGVYTAKTLALHNPALLILAARSHSSLDSAVSAIKEVAPSCPIKPFFLDLSSIRTVRAAAAELKSWIDVPKIDILINNAAIMWSPWAVSEDGIEQQFATNHIGTWLFTNLIIEKIIAAKGRVVNVSSAGHRLSGVRFDDVNFKDGKEYKPDTAYGQSKTGNILMAISLASKLASKDVTAYSLHPGVIWTNLGRHTPLETLQKRGIMDENGKLIEGGGGYKWKSHSQGSATTLVAALDPNIVDRSGAYLCDCKVDHNGIMEPYAFDKENAERLWQLSEKLVGEKFEF